MPKKKIDKKLYILFIDKHPFSGFVINIFNRTLRDKNKKVVKSKFNNFLELNKSNIFVLFNFQKKIIKANNLKKIKYPINFHPGSTKFPGRGGYSWALYKNSINYGITAHFMEKKIDTGKIIFEENFKIYDYDNIESLKFKSFLSSLKIFYNLLLQFYHNKKIEPIKKKWIRKPYKISDLSKINIIKKKTSLAESKRILRSTVYYPHGPYKIINKKKIKIKLKKNINIL